MRRERVEQLLERIRSLPDDGFYYAGYWEDYEADDAWSRGQLLPWLDMHACGTAGCVVGTGIILFRLEWEFSGQDPGDLLQKYLEFDGETAQTVFYTQCELAVRTDAIKRLEHLLAVGSMQGYRWSDESWYQHCPEDLAEIDLKQAEVNRVEES